MSQCTNKRTMSSGQYLPTPSCSESHYIILSKMKPIHKLLIRRQSDKDLVMPLLSSNVFQRRKGGKGGAKQRNK